MIWFILYTVIYLIATFSIASLTYFVGRKWLDWKQWGTGDFMWAFICWPAALLFMMWGFVAMATSGGLRGWIGLLDRWVMFIGDRRRQQQWRD